MDGNGWCDSTIAEKGGRGRAAAVWHAVCLSARRAPLPSSIPLLTRPLPTLPPPPLPPLQAGLVLVEAPALLPFHSVLVFCAPTHRREDRLFLRPSEVLVQY